MKGGANTTHGHARKRAQSSTYISWLAMKRRVLKPNAKDYEHYGGRGIVR
jgi:hypothetical protein